MVFLLQKRFHVLKSLIVIVLVAHLTSTCDSYTSPLNCTEPSRLCTTFLAFKPSPNQTLAVIMSMFDVLPDDVTVEGNGRDYVFVRKNCSCTNSFKYLTNTTYTVRQNGGSLYGTVVDAYGGLGYLANFTRTARAGTVVALQLLCGCSNGLWNYLMSYVMKEGDSIEMLASRFGVSMDSIETVNEIDDADNVTVGALYYIPLNSVPGEPYPVRNDVPLAAAPPPLLVANVAGDGSNENCFSCDKLGEPILALYIITLP